MSGGRGRFLSSLGLVAVLLAVAACGGDEADRLAVPGENGFLYDVEGNTMYLECSGSGEPTVVLEAGLAGDHRNWSEIVPAVERRTRVCSYDRSGVAYSESGAKRAAAREKVDDLRALLDAAGEEGPYVLVGHSYGGMLVRLYAAAHEEDVAGLVLVDSAHPDEVRRLEVALLAAHGSSRELLDLLDERRRAFAGPNDEGVDWRRSTEEIQAARSLNALPLVVITAGLNELPDDQRKYGEVSDRVWLSLQRELARLSTDAVHVVADASGHFVMSHLGQPQLVARAVDEVIDAVRAERPLGRCEEVFAPRGRTCLRGRP